MATDIEVRELFVELTADEVMAYRLASDEVLAAHDKLVNDIKAQKSALDRLVKESQRKMLERNQAVLTKRELRPVECMWFERATHRELIRLDTDKVVETRPLSDDARQARLPFPDPPASSTPRPPVASDADHNRREDFRRIMLDEIGGWSRWHSSVAATNAVCAQFPRENVEALSEEAERILRTLAKIGAVQCEGSLYAPLDLPRTAPGGPDEPKAPPPAPKPKKGTTKPTAASKATKHRTPAKASAKPQRKGSKPAAPPPSKGKPAPKASSAVDLPKRMEAELRKVTNEPLTLRKMAARTGATVAQVRDGVLLSKKRLEIVRRRLTPTGDMEEIVLLTGEAVASLAPSSTPTAKISRAAVLGPLTMSEVKALLLAEVNTWSRWHSGAAMMSVDKALRARGSDALLQDNWMPNSTYSKVKLQAVEELVAEGKIQKASPAQTWSSYAPLGVPRTADGGPDEPKPSKTSKAKASPKKPAHRDIKPAKVAQASDDKPTRKPWGEAFDLVVRQLASAQGTPILADTIGERTGLPVDQVNEALALCVNAEGLELGGGGFIPTIEVEPRQIARDLPRVVRDKVRGLLDDNEAGVTSRQLADWLEIPEGLALYVLRALQDLRLARCVEGTWLPPEAPRPRPPSPPADPSSTPLRSAAERTIPLPLSTPSPAPVALASAGELLAEVEASTATASPEAPAESAPPSPVSPADMLPEMLDAPPPGLADLSFLEGIWWRVDKRPRSREFLTLNFPHRPKDDVQEAIGLLVGAGLATVTPTVGKPEGEDRINGKPCRGGESCVVDTVLRDVVALLATSDPDGTGMEAHHLAALLGVREGTAWALMKAAQEEGYVDCEAGHVWRKASAREAAE